MTVVFEASKLLEEKKLHPEWIFFIGDKQKNPQTIIGKWRDVNSQTYEELLDLVEKTKQRKDVEAWNWGIRTGINDLACLDFDWEFIYYLWVRKFGDRAKTITYRTTNKGYRVIFKTSETDNDNPYKNNLHTEFENKGYAVLGGYAEDEEKTKQPYIKLPNLRLYPDKNFCYYNELTTDNTLISDTKNWLKEVMERFDFLQYRCVFTKKKHIRLSHDQRLAILQFMLSKDFSDEEIHDFFRAVYDTKGRDYNKDITNAQIKSGKEFKEKGGCPFPCKPKQRDNGSVSVPLYQIFNFNPDDCVGCLRRKFVDKSPKEIEMEETLKSIKKKYKLKCPTDTRELLVYDEGFYSEKRWLIEQELEEKYGSEMKTRFVEEVAKHLERQNFIERQDINKFVGKIPLKNGLFNFEACKLEKFDPKTVYTYKLNVDYKPKKKCSNWLKFVSEVLNPEDIPLLQEIMGYCLLPDIPLHKMFWFYGVGRNGKGVIIRTIEEILGKENCSALNLSEFTENRRFSLCRLYGKFLNVSSEPKLTKYGLQTTVLKMVTGQDTIYAEIKGKNERLQFTNFSKLFVLGNHFPKVDDDSLGWKERRVVLKFPNEFTGDKNVPNIEQRWIPEELPGILNWMLEGLFRLQKNKCFTKTKTTEEMDIEFEKASNPFNAWIIEKCELNPAAYLLREEALENYNDYCDELGVARDSKTIFFGKMRTTRRVKELQKRINGKRERIFEGITFKNVENDESVPNVPHVPRISNYLEKEKEEKENIKQYKKHGTSVTSVTFDDKSQENNGLDNNSDYKKLCEWIVKEISSEEGLTLQKLQLKINSMGFFEPVEFLTKKLLNDGKLRGLKT